MEELPIPLTEKEQRRATLERLYETNHFKDTSIIETLKSYYYLSFFGYYTNRQKYDLYWEIAEFLYEKKYGEPYED